MKFDYVGEMKNESQSAVPPPSLQVDFEVADETWPCPQNLIKSRHTENQQVEKVQQLNMEHKI